MKWQDLLRPLQMQPDEQTQVVIQTETIPIVFVPGIMGSRLKRNEGGKDRWVWDPDREKGMLWRYGLFVNGIELPAPMPAAIAVLKNEANIFEGEKRSSIA